MCGRSGRLELVEQCVKCLCSTKLVSKPASLESILTSYAGYYLGFFKEALAKELDVDAFWRDPALFASLSPKTFFNFLRSRNDLEKADEKIPKLVDNTSLPLLNKEFNFYLDEILEKINLPEKCKSWNTLGDFVNDIKPLGIKVEQVEDCLKIVAIKVLKLNMVDQFYLSLNREIFFPQKLEQVQNAFREIDTDAEGQKTFISNCDAYLYNKRSTILNDFLNYMHKNK